MIESYEKLYEIVGQELKEGAERPGLMARAIAESDGDPNRAKSLYIKHRIEQLKENSDLESSKGQGTEVETFLAEFEEFPLFVSATHKILPKLGSLSNNGKLKVLRDKTPSLLYKTAHYLHYTKSDVKEAKRYYCAIIERFPQTQESAWSSQDLDRIKKISNKRKTIEGRVVRRENEDERESTFWSDNFSGSDDRIIELKNPMNNWLDRPPGIKDERSPSQVFGGTSEDELRIFIGRRSTKYLRRFRKFRKGRTDRFSVTWHWPAFIVGFWWMFYRKLYGWGLLELLLSLIPGAWLISRPIFAVTANYLVFKRATTSIVSLKESKSHDLSTLNDAIQRAGGIDSWVPYMAIPLIIIHILLVAVTSSFILVMWPFLQVYFR